MENSVLRSESVWKTILPYSTRLRYHLTKITNFLFLHETGKNEIRFLRNGTSGTLKLGKDDEYQLVHALSIDEDKQLLIMAVPRGIRTFICGEQCVPSGGCDASLDSTSVAFGHFFQNENQKGIVAIEGGTEAKFFALSEETNGTEKFLVSPVHADTRVLSENCGDLSKLMLVKIRKFRPEMLMCRSPIGFHFFELNKHNIVKVEMKIEYGNEGKKKLGEEVFFFPSLSRNEDWNDVVVFNSSGMFLFQYDENISKLRLLNYNAMFSADYGWTKNYLQTVKFEDVDDDGSDEMIFTGPQGLNIISFDVFAKKWRALLDTENLTVEQRHANAVLVLPREDPSSRSFQLLLHQSDILALATIKEAPAELVTIPNSSQAVSGPVIGLLTFGGSVDEKPKISTIYLRDREFWTELIKPIKPQWGRPTFVLPLLEDPSSGLAFRLFYDGRSKTSELMGVGWSTDKNFIFLQPGEGDTYVLVVENAFYVLEQTYNQDSFSTQLIFTAKSPRNGNKELQIMAEFDPSTNLWKIKFGPNHWQYYGRHEDYNCGAVVSHLGWKDWRGPGTDEFEREYVDLWSLAAVEIGNSKRCYEYEVERVHKGQLAYNAAIYLKKIYDSSSQVEFVYGTSHTGEPRVISLEERNGNDPYYLIGYNFKSQTTQQNISFNQTLVNGELYLLDIKQESDFVEDAVLKITYSQLPNGENVPSSILLPTGAEIVYEYKSSEELTPLKGMRPTGLKVSTSYFVSFGPNFTLVSYLIKPDEIVLRLFKGDISEEMYNTLPDTTPSKGHWPPIIAPCDDGLYEVLVGRSFFAVVFNSHPNKFTYAFGQYPDGTWEATPQRYISSNDSVVLSGNDIILISDYKSVVTLIEWSQGEKRWEVSPRADVGEALRSVAVFGNRYVIYDDKSLVLGFKDPRKQNKFSEVVLLKNAPSLLTETLDTIRTFDLSPDLRDVVFSFFRNNAVKMSNDLIILSSFFRIGVETFSMKVETFVLRPDNTVTPTETLVFPQDDVDHVNYYDVTDGGRTYNLTYDYDMIKDKYLIKLRSMTNATQSQIELFNATVTKEMNSPATRFLLNLGNYYVALRGQTVECNDRVDAFGGSKWHALKDNKEENPDPVVSVPLGNEFVLKRDQALETIKLYNANGSKMLFDFGVQQLENLQIHYPVYIASQPKGEPIRIVEFNRSGMQTTIKQHILWDTDTMTSFASPQAFVVISDANEDTAHLKIYPIQGLRTFLPNYVVTATKVLISGESGGSKERVTGYTYDPNSLHFIGDTLFYGHASVVPGNSQKNHGFIRYVDQSVQFYDGQGLLLKEADQEQNNQQQQCPETRRERGSMMYDKTGRLEIADFSPFTFFSNMCGFVGFEDYEARNLEWVFDEVDIVRDKFAFTGRNVLRLSGRAMKGSFLPQFQHREYLVSSWIRTFLDDVPKPGDVTSYLTVVLFTIQGREVATFPSSVKRRFVDWSYLEVIVDLHNVHKMLEKLEQPQQTLMMEIRVSPATNSTIDVDNVRFSPLNHIFDINVYDSDLNKPVAILGASGAPTRYVYDKYGKQIAEIDESNRIREFLTYTKGSYQAFGGSSNPRCEIRIIPETAFYQEFSSSSPQKLYHDHSENKSSLSLEDLDQDSYGVRFLYSLLGDSFILVNKAFELRREGEDAKLSFESGSDKVKLSIPTEGEFLILKEGERVMVWIDGALFFDQHTSVAQMVRIVAEGEMQLQQMMIFSRPQIQVTYKNALDEEIQRISLSSTDSAVIRAMLYDELGRQRISVQPVEVTRPPHESLLSYAADLVTNDDPSSEDSVWTKGELYGKVYELVGHPFGFSEVVYQDNPLMIKSRVGMPGELFSASGKYARRFDSKPSKSFLLSNYPPDKKFHYQVESKTSFTETSIYNTRNLKVASYIDVADGRDLFSTFEFNENGFVTRILPPMFYDEFGKFDANHDLINVTQASKKQQEQIGTVIGYDERNNPVRKTTPDTGPLESVFDKDNRLRFSVQYLRESPHVIGTVTYFTYDLFGRLTSTGWLRQPPPRTQLLQLNVPETNLAEYQRFHHSYFERDPRRRHKIVRKITKELDVDIFEELILDARNNVISKRIQIPNGTDEPITLLFDKRFEGDKLKEVLFPAGMFGKPFRLVYGYDKLGRMVTVGIPGQPKRFLKIAYNANDQIVRETFTPSRRHEFTRSYSYNDPGFLVDIEDPFLREQLSYSKTSFDRSEYGNGMLITWTKFTAKWLETPRGYEVGLREDSFMNDFVSRALSKQCFQELKRGGYVNSNNRQERMFCPDDHGTLSPACTNGTVGRHLKRVLGKRGFPSQYGFFYKYGHYEELTEAKYFVGNMWQESAVVGQDEHDVNSYEIDPNGNHLRFHVGFDHYELKYELRSNRIKEVSYGNDADFNGKRTFAMRHDSRGNVVAAPHKGIKSMKYHPVSNRLQVAELNNGHTARFGYDSKGERVSKRLTNANGRVLRETHYLRDGDGRSLVERELIFNTADQPPDVVVTMYIYGPKSLIGFVRRDQFYSVITDHEGSVRLIVRDGEVVAAYDYTPYGNLMRIYGSSPDVHCSYRFTGQEWDRELRLYNYHARFYDPAIGRFFQVDPLAQYFSPYKYAGNSPVSMVDPTGEFGVMATIAIVSAFTALGGYVGLSAHHKSWNPKNWHWDLHWPWKSDNSFNAAVTGLVFGHIVADRFLPSVQLWERRYPSVLGSHLVSFLGLFSGLAFTVFYGDPLVPIIREGWFAFSSPLNAKRFLMGAAFGVDFTARFMPVLEACHQIRSSSLILREWFSLPFLTSSYFILKRFSTSRTTNYLKILKAQLFRKQISFDSDLSFSILKTGKGLQPLTTFPSGSNLVPFLENENLSFLPQIFGDYYKTLFFASIAETTSSSSSAQRSARREEFENSKIECLQNFLLKTPGNHTSSDVRFLRKSELVTDFYVLVKFPNFVLLYSQNEQLFVRLSEEAVSISNEPEDPNLVLNVKEAMENVRIMLEQENQMKFKRENVREWFKSVTMVDATTIGRITAAVTELFEEKNGYITQDEIAVKLKDLNVESTESVKIKQKYQNKSMELSAVLEKIQRKKFSNQRQFAEKEYLENVVKNLKLKELIAAQHTVDSLSEIIWAKLKPYRDLLTKWQVEPASPNGKNLTYAAIPNPYDNKQDFKYVSSFKAEPFENCRSCIIPSPSSPIRIRDIDWLEFLNGNLEGRSKSFLLPIEDSVEIGVKKRTKRAISGDNLEFQNQTDDGAWLKNAKNHFKRFLPTMPLLNAKEDNNTQDTLNVLEMGDKYITHLANSANLLLTEVVLAKCFKRKIFKSSMSTAADNVRFTTEEAFACEMIELFEKSLRKGAHKIKIPEDQLDTSFNLKLYKEITRAASGKRFDEIVHLMKISAKQAVPLPDEQFEKFFSKLQLQRKIDKIILKRNGLHEPRADWPHHD